MPISAPRLSVAAEGGGNTKPGSRKEIDALDRPLVNRTTHANTVVTGDLLLQTPSMQSVPDSDLVIVGPASRQRPLESTGDRRPHPSTFRYDIV